MLIRLVDFSKLLHHLELCKSLLLFALATDGFLQVALKGLEVLIFGVRSYVPLVLLFHA
jgi:hypothetical protein